MRNILTISLRYLACAVLAALCHTQARGASITLDFEGLGSQANILNFYNGGTDSQGNSGPNFGIAFGSNTLALRESDPFANFALPPSGETIMFFLTGSAILNNPAGFDTGFSFWYTTVSFSGVVNVYDGLDATGNLLATIDLAALGAGPDPQNPFSNWRAVGVTFNGIARSIDFSGTVNQVGFDDITFGSATPGGVPEPSALGLTALGMAGVIVLGRKRPK